MIRARHPVRAAESTLMSILLLEGILGLAGGVMLVADPSGRLLQMPSAWLHGTPFSSFLVPGLLLASALGLLPLFASFALWRVRTVPGSVLGSVPGSVTDSVPGPRRLERALGRDTAWLASFVAGVAIMIWIVVQIAMVRMFHPMQAFIFTLGAAIVALSLLPSVRRKHALRDVP